MFVVHSVPSARRWPKTRLVEMWPVPGHPSRLAFRMREKGQGRRARISACSWSFLLRHHLVVTQRQGWGGAAGAGASVCLAFSMRGGRRGRDSAHAFPRVRGEFFSVFGLLLPKYEACRGAAGAGASVRLAFRMRKEVGRWARISACSWPLFRCLRLVVTPRRDWEVRRVLGHPSAWHCQ
jgi:hypothetical protein